MGETSNDELSAATTMLIVWLVNVMMVHVVMMQVWMMHARTQHKEQSDVRDEGCTHRQEAATYLQDPRYTSPSSTGHASGPYWSQGHWRATGQGAHVAHSRERFCRQS
jgi:hypothetical protein